MKRMAKKPQPVANLKVSKLVCEIWTNRHRRRANEEGWDLFDNRDEDVLEIQKVDDSDVFQSDVDAIDFVWKEARFGSLFHVLALYLDRRRASIHIFVPHDVIVAAKTGLTPGREEMITQITGDLPNLPDKWLIDLHEYWEGIKQQEEEEGES
jgi:hypothetical protein